MPPSSSPSHFPGSARHGGPARPPVYRLLLAWGLVAALIPAFAGAAEEEALAARPSSRFIELTAFTRPRARLPLVAEMAGRVEAVLQDIGDPVGEDGLFARLDATFLKLELEENGVEQARLRDQIAYDQREVERNRELARKNNVAAAQLDEARQTLRNDTQALRRLEVQARVLAEKISRTQIRAPSGWRLIERLIEPGQWVGDGERLGEAADFSILLLPFSLTPEQLVALRETGETLSVEIPELGVQVPAAIYRVNPALDEATRKIDVDLRLQTAIEPQRGGLRAELRLQLPDPENLLIPAAAVHRGFEESWVQPLNGEPLVVTILGGERIEGREWLRARAPGLEPGDPLRPRE
ncbi:efflux RND transporter periplasmic adaptor subunit [Imhoffiella purpurea]|uniref:Secretion protein HlyD n=1 Tax=Imhoffiella purpurea TaxID=1249627 RepID=W9VBW5_9GAMM|nr:efflux RND transporter periplasmic adaptor subunit [Imhoffiella purpurea]EXJ13532.1 Secretion protein HlyD [Imhoffiella purpurea]